MPPATAVASTQSKPLPASVEQVHARFQELYTQAHSEQLNSSQARKDDLTEDENTAILTKAWQIAVKQLRIEYTDIATEYFTARDKSTQ